MSVLEVNDLHVVYEGEPDTHAVRGVSFSLEEGENLGLVGESGCGKTTVANAIMQSLPDNGRIVQGEVLFDGVDITNLTDAELSAQRWEDISMITQSAMNSLNPVYKLKDQIKEAIQAHRDVSDTNCYERAGELFELVGIEPGRIDDYPHQLSGGMRQRAIIAMSLALDPKLILADEPTTALDVIVQEQILYRISQIQNEIGSSMMMITHDMSVVAETCDKVVVMYGGEVMESGSTEDIFTNAYHPYTLGLQNAFPNITDDPGELTSIPGSPPNLSDPPAGCPFAARCPFSGDVCSKPLSEQSVGEDHIVRCHAPTSFDEIRAKSPQAETWGDKDENREVTYGNHS